MVAASHAGFLSRQQLGMAAPASISRSITPEGGGSAFHHGGDNVPVSSHAACVETWLAWQRFHMGRNHPRPLSSGRHWVDLAYTLGVCIHGWLLAGRGAGIRTAANGTNDGNQRFYAICGIIGARQSVPDAMLAAFAEAALLLRESGAGMATVGHTDLKATACPHPTLLRLARDLNGKTIRRADGTSAPKTPEDLSMATEDQVEAIVRRHTGTLRERANETVRLQLASVAFASSQIRRQVGLPADAASDRIQATRVRNGSWGRFERYDLEAVTTVLREAAERVGAEPTLHECRVAEGTAGVDGVPALG